MGKESLNLQRSAKWFYKYLDYLDESELKSSKADFARQIIEEYREEHKHEQE